MCGWRGAAVAAVALSNERVSCYISLIWEKIELQIWSKISTECISLVSSGSSVMVKMMIVKACRSRDIGCVPDTKATDICLFWSHYGIVFHYTLWSQVDPYSRLFCHLKPCGPGAVTELLQFSVSWSIKGRWHHATYFFLARAWIKSDKCLAQ